MNMRLILLLSIIVLSAIVVSAHGEEGTEFYDSHHDAMHSGWFGYGVMGTSFGLGWIIMLLLIILLVLVIWALLDHLTGTKGRKRR